MLSAIFWFLLSLAIGVGCLFVAFNKYSRHKLAKQNWLWHYAKNNEDKETAEALAMMAPLFAGVLILSGAVAGFLIWLLT